MLVANTHTNVAQSNAKASPQSLIEIKGNTKQQTQQTPKPEREKGALIGCFATCALIGYGFVGTLS
jgi:hypothetical protein